MRTSKPLTKTISALFIATILVGALLFTLPGGNQETGQLPGNNPEYQTGSGSISAASSHPPGDDAVATLTLDSEAEKWVWPGEPLVDPYVVTITNLENQERAITIEVASSGDWNPADITIGGMPVTARTYNVPAFFALPVEIDFTAVSPAAMGSSNTLTITLPDAQVVTPLKEVAVTTTISTPTITMEPLGETSHEYIPAETHLYEWEVFFDDNRTQTSVAQDPNVDLSLTVTPQVPGLAWTVSSVTPASMSGVTSTSNPPFTARYTVTAPASSTEPNQAHDLSVTADWSTGYSLGTFTSAVTSTTSTTTSNEQMAGSGANGIMTMVNQGDEEKRIWPGEPLVDPYTVTVTNHEVDARQVTFNVLSSGDWDPTSTLTIDGVLTNTQSYVIPGLTSQEIEVSFTAPTPLIQGTSNTLTLRLLDSESQLLTSTDVTTTISTPSLLIEYDPPQLDELLNNGEATHEYAPNEAHTYQWRVYFDDDRTQTDISQDPSADITIQTQAQTPGLNWTVSTPTPTNVPGYQPTLQPPISTEYTVTAPSNLFEPTEIHELSAHADWSATYTLGSFEDTFGNPITNITSSPNGESRDRMLGGAGEPVIAGVSLNADKETSHRVWPGEPITDAYELIVTNYELTPRIVTLTLTDGSLNWQAQNITIDGVTTNTTSVLMQPATQQTFAVTFDTPSTGNIAGTRNALIASIENSLLVENMAQTTIETTFSEPTTIITQTISDDRHQYLPGESHTYTWEVDFEDDRTQNNAFNPLTDWTLTATLRDSGTGWSVGSVTPATVTNYDSQNQDLQLASYTVTAPMTEEDDAVVDFIVTAEWPTYTAGSFLVIDNRTASVSTTESFSPVTIQGDGFIAHTTSPGALPVESGLILQATNNNITIETTAWNRTSMGMERLGGGSLRLDAYPVHDINNQTTIGASQLTDSNGQASWTINLDQFPEELLNNDLAGDYYFAVVWEDPTVELISPMSLVTNTLLELAETSAQETGDQTLFNAVDNSEDRMLEQDLRLIATPIFLPAPDILQQLTELIADGFTGSMFFVGPQVGENGFLLIDDVDETITLEGVLYTDPNEDLVYTPYSDADITLELRKATLTQSGVITETANFTATTTTNPDGTYEFTIPTNSLPRINATDEASDDLYQVTIIDTNPDNTDYTSREITYNYERNFLVSDPSDDNSMRTADGTDNIPQLTAFIINGEPSQDRDGDGIIDDNDNCPDTPNVNQEDMDGDGIGDACDNDVDGDGVDDNPGPDNCPTTPNPTQADQDNDNIGDACDDDVDGDNIDNTVDNCPYTPNPAQTDSNNDGVGDACEGDQDGDGIIDGLDNCPTISNTDQADQDNDNIGDACDDDVDGDGVSNAIDNCMYTANADQADSNNDGVGDACEGDQDGDGIIDGQDNCPTTPNTMQEDLDNDGIGDACDPDIDDDGIVNEGDNCAYTYNPTQDDVDEDGVGDVCDPMDDRDPDIDDDGIANSQDNCPYTPNADQADLDGDGNGDACDQRDDRPDQDNDGVKDVEDNCPSTSNYHQEDADSDGLGDACDPTDNRPDQDNDGVKDEDDNCPVVPNPHQDDIDNDGIGDACDPVDDVNDPDNDGVQNRSDNCPHTANTDQKDTDSDGIGDACDEDDDNDAWSDEDEARLGTDPKDPSSKPDDMDGDGIADSEDSDADGDGIDNQYDNCPDKANQSQTDSDGDGHGDACDDSHNYTASDYDDDGIPDHYDNCPTKANSDQANQDGDNKGDACDNDIDGDGYLNGEDAYPLDPMEWRNCDGDALPDNQDNDDDNDQLTDNEEQALGTNQCNPDTDGDGLSDSQELNAGSDPLDPKDPSIKVTNLTVEKIGDKNVQVTWENSNENVKQFIVWQSRDNQNLELIAVILATEQTNYELENRNLRSGVYQYHITSKLDHDSQYDEQATAASDYVTIDNKCAGINCQALMMLGGGAVLVALMLTSAAYLIWRRQN